MMMNDDDPEEDDDDPEEEDDDDPEEEDDDDPEEEDDDDPKEAADLSPEAIALLEFTSDTRRSAASSEEAIYITSKDAFVWAGIAFSIAKAQPRRVEDIDILASLYEAVELWSDYLQNSYRALPQLSLHAPPELEPRGFIAQLGYKEDVCFSVIQSFSNSLKAKKDLSLLPLEKRAEINEAIREGYRELMQKDLISDPILEGGMAILGFVPFSVTKKTRKGQAEYLRIRALLWRYERKRTQAGHTEFEFKWEVARIANALKRGLASAFHEATKDGGDEPD